MGYLRGYCIESICEPFSLDDSIGGGERVFDLSVDSRES